MDALRARVLVFTSPSNYGNFRSITYPGILYSVNKVMCMFATTAECRPLLPFNPVAARKATYSFAILGHNVTIPPLKQPLTGTSLSTVIGTALAARILDFSRHPDIRGCLKDARHLRRVEGMSAVFAEMVDDPDNGYHCMTPLKLLPRNYEEEDRQYLRRKVSERI